MLSSCKLCIVRCLSHKLDLAEVKGACAKAIKGLLEFRERVYKGSVFVERYRTILTYLGRIGMFVGRTHFNKNSNQISYFEWLTRVNRLPFVDNCAICTFIRNTFVPSERKGVVKFINA